MAQAVIMPKLGQTVEEAMLVKWHKKEGDAVKKGDVLFEIETDKAVLEAESFYDGILLKILVKEEETVPVSSTVAFIGEKGEKAPDAPAAAAPAPAPKPAPEPNPEASTPPPSTINHQPSAIPPSPAPSTINHQPLTMKDAPQRIFISPRAKALVKKSVINPVNITGSGPNGRIVVKDVETYLDSNNYASIKISPTAKQLAIKEDIDILTVKGTGESKRIMIRDVECAIAEKPKPMSRMRQVISQRLTQSFRDTPHFYVTVGADMTELLKYRQELKEQGAKYSVTDFILEAVILSLEEFPIVNSVTDGSTVKWNSQVDLGLAVSIENGLVVPPIRDAASLSMVELHDVAKELATKAREGKLLPDQMSGSTFTVSNMGMLNVENFLAIVNPGEGAILAVASTMETPVVVNGKITARSIMKMTLSVDHRIIDGTVGAEFINAIKNKLEDMELWKSLT
ncbi:dihydrolipoamide acetyltransferase family protein [Verrucomicrobiota bacterium]